MPNKPANFITSTENRRAVHMTMLLLSVSLSACAHQIGGRLLKDDGVPVSITTSDMALFDLAGNSYALKDLELALDSAMALHPSSQQLTVFLHGMGPYPQKAYKEHELAGVAANFDSAVLMLHWPSWRGSWFKLTRQNALASGRALQLFWQQLHLQRKASKWADKRWLLIAHSMGAEVMRGVSEQEHTQVFDSALLVAPETELKSHAQWLSKLQLAKRTAVLINRQDNVLGYAKVASGKDRLGLDFDARSASATELATGVSYLVVENNNQSHKLHYRDQPAALKPLLQQLNSDHHLDKLCKSNPGDTVVVALDKKNNNEAYCQLRIPY